MSDFLAKPNKPSKALRKDGAMDGFTVILSNIAVISGLNEKKPPTTYIEVTITGSTPAKTIMAKKSAHPKWLEGEEPMRFIRLRPSSTLKLRLFRLSRFSWKRPHVIGENEQDIIELFSEGKSTYNCLISIPPLINVEDSESRTAELIPIEPKATPIMLSFRIIVTPSVLSSSINELGIDAAAKALADARLALAREEQGSLISKISPASEDLAVQEADTQALAGGLTVLNGEQVIGALLTALDNFVKVGDEITAAHPLIKVAWAVATYAYKAAKAQQQLDEESRQLAEDLSMMLAYATACRDLVPIEGRENIVIQVVRLTKEGACIIDACMAHHFVVRAAIGPFTGLRNRLEDCQRRVKEVRREFDTAVQVDIRDRVKTIETEAILSVLPSARGASWTPSLACMDGTRSSLLSSISSWIRADSETASIMWLTASPGAGKTAVAHTVARNASSEAIVVLSFFFDRTVEQRNDPSLFVGTLVRDLAGYDQNYRTSVCDILNRKRDLASAQPLRQFTELIVDVATTFASRILVVIDALDECSDYSGDLLTILCEHIPKLPSSYRILLTSRPEDILMRRLPGYSHVYATNIELSSDDNHSDISAYVYAQRLKIASYSELGPSWPTDEQCKALTSKAGGLFIWISLVMDFIGKGNLRKRDRKWNLESILSQDVTILKPTQIMNELYDTVLSAYDWTNKRFVEDYHLVVGTIIAAKEPLSKRSLRSLSEDDDDIIDDTLSVLSPLFISIEDDDTPVQLLHLTLHEFLTDPLRSKDYFIDEAEHSRSLGYRCLKLLTKSLSKKIPGLGWSSFWDQYQYHPIPSFQVPEAVAYSCHFWIYHIINTADESRVKYLNILDTFTPYLISWLEVASARGEFPPLCELRSWIMMNSPLRISTFGQVISSEGFALSLETLSNRLSDAGRLRDALRAMAEALHIRRQLAKDRSETFTRYIATSLFSLSRILMDTGRGEDALEPIEEAVNIYRQLSKRFPEFNRELSRSLSGLSLIATKAGHPEDALKAVEEAVNINRQLAKDCPGEFDAGLASSLANLAAWLGEAGHEKDAALKAIEEAVNIFRQLAKDRPEKFNASLANSLTNLCARLSDVGRRTDALKTIEESVNIYRQLAMDQPDAFNSGLTTSLNILCIELHSAGRREEALKVIQETVNIQRELAEDRPEASNADLAMYLINLSGILGHVGRQKDAVKAMEEAANIRRQLAKGHSKEFNRDYAMSLNRLCETLERADCREDALKVMEEAVNICRQVAKDHPEASIQVRLAIYLNNLSLRLRHAGRREDALKAVEETVNIYRQLAKGHHKASNQADLATSLMNLSVMFTGVGRREDALTAIEEAVNIRRQLAKNHPEASDPGLAKSLNNLCNSLRGVGRREDALKAIVEAVNICRKLAKDRPDAFNSYLAKCLRNLSDMLSYRHREEALKAIEEAVNIYQQVAKDRPKAYNPDLAASLNTLSNRLRDVGHREDALKAIEEALDIYRQLAKDRPGAFNHELAMSLNNLSNMLSESGHREDALKAVEEAVNIYRQLAKDHHEASNLATSLTSLSVMFTGVGRREDALTAIEEAVNVRRQLAKDHPEASDPDLGMSLNGLSCRLSDVGRQEDALKAVEEAVNIYRPLAKDRPDAFNYVLAMSLNNLSASLVHAGHREDALNAVAEAVNINRDLAKGRPEALNHDLARSLYNSSIIFSGLGLKEDALRAAKESLGLYRSVHSQRPIVFRQHLINALKRVAQCLSASDQDEEASKYREEAEALEAEAAPTTVQPDT